MTEDQEEYLEGEVTETTLVPVSKRDYVPSFAIGLQEAKERLEQFKQFIEDQMVEGEDWGKIPGVEKKTLLQPGAQKLCNIFGFAPRFEEVRVVENWEEGLFFYVHKCTIYNKRTGQIEADCTGSANSLEERHRYRYPNRKCPSCGQATVMQSKFDDGWFCWAKQGGCGAKFPEGTEAIESQVIEKIDNPEPYDLVNTLMKMSQKRALVGVTLIATRGAGIFTQDVEDMSPSTFTSGGAPKKPTGKKATSDRLPFGKHKGLTLEEISETDLSYIRWGIDGLEGEWQQKFKDFLDAQEPEEEGEYIISGDFKHPANAKINQEWFEKLKLRQKEAGMVQKHLENHLKKHYDVERIAELTFKQAVKFGKHLKSIIDDKKKPTDDNEDYEPYTLNQPLMDRANALVVEDWDFGTWYTLHVVKKIPPNMPIKGDIEKAVEQFITQLEAGENEEAMTKAFDARMKEIPKE